MSLAETMKGADPAHAIEIADRVWWVGHYLPDDAFQCHVYLLEHGDQSVLFDPGSMLTYEHTLAKIAEVTDFSNIRWFVCHHQDPDITSAMPKIDALITRDDARLVSHWRGQALIKHYGLKLPFWMPEEHEWKLDLGGRKLKFLFTPYAHFPGAFVTFDEQTGALFSSDIFGGFTEGFSLVAESMDYFESLKPFHEHYIPSRDVLLHSLTRIEKLDLKMICPQHGSIIPDQLVRPIIEKLKTLDCGLYLLAKEDTDIHRLSRLNQMLADITKTMTVYRDFQDVARALLEVAQRFVPARMIEFFARSQGHDDKVLHLGPETRYKGNLTDPPLLAAMTLGKDAKSWGRRHKWNFTLVGPEDAGRRMHALAVPLFSPEKGTIEALALIHLDKRIAINSEVVEMIQQLNIPLQVAVERETIYRTLDLERKQFYERSIRDALTGLYTRFYMQDMVERLFAIHDRDKGAGVSVAMVDIDHFKSVNDTYGHNQGDIVLKQVAAVLTETSRHGDLPVRLGGEEFAVFVAGRSASEIGAFAERLREAVEELQFGPPMEGRKVTASVGVAERRQKESLIDFLGRADAALYRAKQSGRNQVCCLLAQPSEPNIN
ncbi:Diguanylate cyclase [Rhodospirillaceae bacterium LM-1]|nr:Diguanylate cyclase [Rhodospirillaceae bacterium LM-1]